jgi:hypothetical protein
VEAVGEFVPAILGSAGLAGPRSGAALRELPRRYRNTQSLPVSWFRALKMPFRRARRAGCCRRVIPWRGVCYRPH